MFRLLRFSLALLLFTSLVYAEPKSPFTLEAVTTAQKTTSKGIDLNDDVLLRFGTDHDMTMQYSNSNTSLEIRNPGDVVTNDIHIYNLPIQLDVTDANYGTGFYTNMSSGTAFSSSSFAGEFINTYSGTGGASGNFYGIYGDVATNTTDHMASAYGLNFIAITQGAGITDTVGGTFSGINAAGTATTAVVFDGLTAGAATSTDLIGLRTQFTSNGTITNSYALKVYDPTAGTITNNYGVYIASMTRGTNDRAIWLDGNGIGNGIYFDAGDSEIYDDNTDLILNPASTGTGLVRIGATGDQDLIADQINFCGTALDSLAIAKGDCTTATARAVLNFTLTKTGAASVVGIVQATGVNQTTATGPLMVGGIFTSKQDTTTNPTGNADYVGVRATIVGAQNTTGGTFRLKGFEYTAGAAPASSTGATVKNIGMHLRAVPTWTGATETDWSLIAENDIMMTDNHCIYMEGTGGTTLTNGDTKLCQSSSTTDVQLTVDGTLTQTWDNDQIDFGVDAVAGGATNNAILSSTGFLRFGGTGTMLVQGNKNAFCYTSDGTTATSACEIFTTSTASYDFTDTSAVVDVSLTTNDPSMFKLGVRYPRVNPAQITANQNNYTGCDDSGLCVINSDAARDVTGMANPTDGELVYIVNNGSFTITFKQDSASSTNINRFKNVLGADIALVADGMMVCIYQSTGGTTSRWRCALL